MSGSKLLFSLVALLFSFFVIAIGLVLLFLPHLGRVIQSYSSGIGSTLLVVGVLLLFAFYKMCRPSRLLLRMGGAYQLKVENSVIQQLVEKELKVECKINILKKGTIEILADMPYLSEERLEKIEEDLTLLFVRELGYPREFVLNVCPKSLVSSEGEPELA